MPYVELVDGVVVPFHPRQDAVGDTLHIYMANVKSVNFGDVFVSGRLTVSDDIHLHVARLETPAIHLQGGASVMGDLHVAEVFNDGIPQT